MNEFIYQQQEETNIIYNICVGYNSISTLILSTIIFSSKEGLYKNTMHNKEHLNKCAS